MKTEALSILEEKYPDLAFLLKTQNHTVISKHSEGYLQAFSPQDEKSYFVKESAAADCLALRQELENRSRIEAILIFGFDLGNFYLELKEFLDSGISVIFLDNCPWAIEAWLDSEHSPHCFQHANLYIKLVLENRTFEDAIEEICQEFPFERVVSFVTSDFKKNEKALQLQELYLRRSVIYGSLRLESFYQERLFENFFPNYLQMLESLDGQKLSKAFTKMPAIICGAGPSLNEAIPILKQLQDQALIIAGGSTITALSRENISPHFGFAVDPNPEEYDRLKELQCFEKPLFFASRVQPEIFRFTSGDSVYFRTFTGGNFEQKVEKILGVEGSVFHKGMKDEGLSVTVLCLAAAIAMGCDPIFLVGIDLAYVNDKLYADSVLAEEKLTQEKVSGRETILMKTNEFGRTVKTTLKWIMESEVISDFVKQQNHHQVFDCNEKGLGFQGLPKLTLGELAERLGERKDIEALIHQKVIALPKLNQHKTQFASEITKLTKSFSNVKTLITSMIDRATQEEILVPEEDPLIFMALLDIEQESVYTVFLEPLLEDLKRQSQDLSPDKAFQDVWNYLLESVNYYLAIVNRNFFKKG